MPLSNNTNSARKVGDAFGHDAYTTVTGANGDHVRTLHDTVLAYLSDELDAAGISFQGGLGKSSKNTFSQSIFQNVISDHDKRHLQGILPDLVLD